MGFSCTATQNETKNGKNESNSKQTAHDYQSRSVRLDSRWTWKEKNRTQLPDNFSLLLPPTPLPPHLLSKTSFNSIFVWSASESRMQGIVGWREKKGGGGGGWEEGGKREKSSHWLTKLLRGGGKGWGRVIRHAWSDTIYVNTWAS